MSNKIKQVVATGDQQRIYALDENGNLWVAYTYQIRADEISWEKVNDLPKPCEKCGK